AHAEGAAVLARAQTPAPPARDRVPHHSAPRRADPPYDARLVRIIDGDSLVVEAGGARIELRVFGIDAPERGQAWSQRARQALTELVRGRPLRVVPRDRDSYGRTVADVYAD